MIENDRSLRIALAELVRDQVEDGEPTVRKVTGYRDDTEVHYPGMSCEWTVAVVHIFYEDYAQCRVVSGGGGLSSGRVDGYETAELPL